MFSFCLCSLKIPMMQSFVHLRVFHMFNSIFLIVLFLSEASIFAQNTSLLFQRFFLLFCSCVSQKDFSTEDGILQKCLQLLHCWLENIHYLIHIRNIVVSLATVLKLYDFKWVIFHPVKFTKYNCFWKSQIISC